MATRKQTSLQPFFKHFGSKWKLARMLPRPLFKTVIEPFAGGANYSLHHWTRDVVLRDIDSGTIAIWHWLQGATPNDILSLPHDLRGIDNIFTLDIPYPAKLLIQRWLTPQGNRHKVRATAAAIADEDNVGTRWDRVVRRRLARQVPAIRHWDIQLGSYDEIVHDSPATWAIDPPYQKNSSGHNAAVYGEGTASNIDFTALATWCRSRKGEVIVHEQFGADWLPFKTLNARAKVGVTLSREGGPLRQHEVYYHALHR